MEKPLVIAIDMGGTNLRAALVAREGRIVARKKESTRMEEGAQRIAERLAGLCRALMEEGSGQGEVSAVGLGVAGKIDHLNGIVLFSPNLKALDGYPLAAELGKHLELPVVVENDANAFGVGENWVGSGRHLTNWIGLTLGTGVGGALIFENRLWHGDHLGVEGEIGHMIVQPGGPLCGCGTRGCLEAHSSGTALVRGVEEAVSEGRLVEGPLYEAWQKGRKGPDVVYECGLEGDEVALEVFRRMGWALGVALASLFTVLGIRHAIIGGGVSGAWDLFIAPLRRSLEEHTRMFVPEEMVALQSSLGDDAALLGAARLAFQDIAREA